MVADCICGRDDCEAGLDEADYIHVCGDNDDRIAFVDNGEMFSLTQSEAGWPGNRLHNLVMDDNALKQLCARRGFEVVRRAA